MAAAAVLLLLAGPLPAQSRVAEVQDPVRWPTALQDGPGDAWGGNLPPQAGPGTGAVRAALFSALVPGAGQFLQGRRRWILFLTAEAAAWAFHLDAHLDGRGLRSEYRDLAWSVARGGPQPRMDGAFEYYERMSHWTRSGAFDSDAETPDLDPERDPSTYNGAQWALAVSIYLQGDPHVLPGTPGYDQALEYYRGRAYGPEFTWDWSGAPAERERFQDLIEESDDRFRTASVALALVAGNHILSAVDAFAASRLGASPSRLSLHLAQGPAPRYRPYLVFRFSLP